MRTVSVLLFEHKKESENAAVSDSIDTEAGGMERNEEGDQKFI